MFLESQYEINSGGDTFFVFSKKAGDFVRLANGKMRPFRELKEVRLFIESN